MFIERPSRPDDVWSEKFSSIAANRIAELNQQSSKKKKKHPKCQYCGSRNCSGGTYCPSDPH